MFPNNGARQKGSWFFKCQGLPIKNYLFIRMARDWNSSKGEKKHLTETTQTFNKCRKPAVSSFPLYKYSRLQGNISVGCHDDGCCHGNKFANILVLTLAPTRATFKNVLSLSQSLENNTGSTSQKPIVDAEICCLMMQLPWLLPDTHHQILRSPHSEEKNKKSFSTKDIF
jgi:hypothetical protein